jgi:hypothetical protein
MRDRIIAGSFDDIEALLMAAGRKFNDALLELASLYLEQGTIAKHLLMAATLFQRCYETALKDKDELLADDCRRQAPACVERMAVVRSTMTHEDYGSMLIARFMFDRHGHPYPNRSERSLLYYDLIRDYGKVKGSGSREEARLLALLASGMEPNTLAPTRRNVSILPPVAQRVAGPKIGRNTLCTCGSGVKFKVCCGMRTAVTR